MPYNNHSNFKVLDDNLTTISGTKPVAMHHNERVSFHIHFADSATFALELQESNDPRATGTESQRANADWFTTDLSAASPTVSGAEGTIVEGDLVYNFENVNSSACRLLLSPTASGSVTIRATVK